MNVVRTELELGQDRQAVPQEGHLHGDLQPLRQRPRKTRRVLDEHFTWCRDWQDELKQLFDGYVDRKEAAGVLDYDDLLLYWHALLGTARSRPGVRPFGRDSGGWPAPAVERIRASSP